MRPHRYRLQAHCDVDAAAARAELTFVSQGDLAAVFHVYDRLHLDRLPRRYTVGAGGRLTGAWDLSADGGRYDLWVLGPAGFHAHFVG